MEKLVPALYSVRSSSLDVYGALLSEKLTNFSAGYAQYIEYETERQRLAAVHSTSPSNCCVGDYAPYILLLVADFVSMAMKLTKDAINDDILLAIKTVVFFEGYRSPPFASRNMSVLLLSYTRLVISYFRVSFSRNHPIPALTVRNVILQNLFFLFASLRSPDVVLLRHSPADISSQQPAHRLPARSAEIQGGGLPTISPLPQQQRLLLQQRRLHPPDLRSALLQPLHPLPRPAAQRPRREGGLGDRAVSGNHSASVGAGPLHSLLRPRPAAGDREEGHCQGAGAEQLLLCGWKERIRRRRRHSANHAHLQAVPHGIDHATHRRADGGSESGVGSHRLLHAA